MHFPFAYGDMLFSNQHYRAYEWVDTGIYSLYVDVDDMMIRGNVVKEVKLQIKTDLYR